MKNIDSLKIAFMSFIDLTERIIQSSKQFSMQKNVFPIIENDTYKIYNLALKTLMSKEILCLANETSRLCGKGTYKKPFISIEFCADVCQFAEDYLDDDYETAGHVIAIFNFICRSRFVHDVFLNRAYDKEGLFDQYLDLFNRNHLEITYLVPLVNVCFDYSGFDFNEFQIIKYNKDYFNALDEMNTYSFGNYIKPNRFLNDNFRDLWFVQLKERFELDKTFEPWSDKGFYKTYQSKISVNTYISRKLELTLLSILLFQWIEIPDTYYRTGMVITTYEDKVKKNIKFSSAKNPDNDEELFQSPISMKYILECHDHLVDKSDTFRVHKDISDQYVNEWKFDSRKKEIVMNEEQSHYFFDSIKNTSDILKRVYNCDYLNYLQISLAFYFRALISTNQRWERLLWLTTAMEAVLVHRSEKINENISKRLSKVLGDLRFEKEMKKIYDVRSRIIHGDLLPQSILNHTINGAHYLCRRLMMWFVNCVDYIDSNSLSKDYKKKEKLHEIIDSGIDVSFPKGFPNIPEWEGIFPDSVNGIRQIK